MSIIFVTMVCAAVAGPLIAFCWAMKPRQCQQCGAAVEPDPALVRMFTGT
ncbi:MAG: hypothetical protein IAI50_08985 [Candidatus Eremiobacteraeota bacterium]|nr:hypothetical protein [Candidatus Eremiobacteraeota bacterium]